MNTQKTRDIRYDALRFIGLLCVILAHTAPPPLLFQLRNFDVPLLVLVSGVVFALTAKKSEPYLAYVKSRAARLLLPAWTFLIIFFAVAFVGFTFLRVPFPVTTMDVITSFTLDSGIGYVWIIKVFLLTALACPLYLRLADKVSTRNYFVILAAVYAVYEGIVYLTTPLQSAVLSYFLNYYVFYILPYGTVAAIGIILPRLQKKNIISLTGVFGVLFAALAIFYAKTAGSVFVQTQDYKYPAQLYYISYALFASLLVFLLVENKGLQRLMDNSFVRFVGSSTMWIYLWHIAFIYVATFVTFLQKPYFLYFIFLFTASILTVYVQKKVVGYVVKKMAPGTKAADILQTVFLK